MKTLIEKLVLGRDLSETEMEQIMDAIMEGRLAHTLVAAFLVGLRAKGERGDEIAAAARTMRRHALPVKTGLDTVDTCGTGGDYAGTFNISTATGFVLAGAGLPVAKHGNRSLSSSSGSADCLEALGVPIDLLPEDASRTIREQGFAFLFAPAYHPAMKHVMPVRRELGIRTLFNILGPLANPAGAAFQVVGVYAAELIDPVIEALRHMGIRGAMVVHSGLDEVSTAVPTRYARIKAGDIIRGELCPEDAGLARAPLNELTVSSPAESAALIESVFTGEQQGAPRTAVLLNAGAAFMAVDPDLDLRTGVSLAGTVIDDGRAFAALERVRRP